MGSVGQFIRWFELIGRHCWGGVVNDTWVGDNGVYSWFKYSLKRALSLSLGPCCSVGKRRRSEPSLFFSRRFGLETPFSQ